MVVVQSIQFDVPSNAQGYPVTTATPSKLQGYSAITAVPDKLQYKTVVVVVVVVGDAISVTATAVMSQLSFNPE